ncbi:hypothetical protein FOZ60_008193 [Perkinsus olseni]|uniref:Uncharacterized protein n=1 Tax=Perkinsus olseni TaxID=32597 RepID=A0A7J6NJT1_PEROL|nr:hypothetical protein FOZ60_008193 [Perkinsus olseni]
MLCALRLLLVHLFIDGVLAKTMLTTAGRAPLNTGQVVRVHAEQEQGRCALIARHFGASAAILGRSSDLSKDISFPWEASVGAVFSKKEGKYVIDYATLGESMTAYRRSYELPTWTAISNTQTLWWLLEPSGLPFTRKLPKTRGMTCEESIVEWGRQLLKKTRASEDKNSAVLAVAREVLKESQLRDTRAERYTHVFGPPQSSLSSTITFIEKLWEKRSRVSSIKFIDSAVPSHLIEIPLLGKNLELMRYWTGRTHQRDADRTEITLRAAQWGIKVAEVGISKDEREYRAAATTIAVAAGWHERLDPVKRTKDLAARSAFHGAAVVVFVVAIVVGNSCF